MKNTQRGSTTVVLVIVIIILVVLGAFFYGKSSSQQAGTNPTPVSGLEKYSDETISFEYPKVLTATKKGNEVTLAHSIPYVHGNPCDFKGDAPPLKDLTDFSASFKVVNKGIQDYVVTSGWPDWDYVSKNPFTSGSWKGYMVSPGVEGCGENIYFLSVTPTQTLIITMPFAAEFNSINADFQKYLDLPGVIVPNQAGTYFNQILSSIKVK